MKKQFIVVILIVALFIVLSAITGITIISDWKSIVQDPVALMTTFVALLSLGSIVCSVIWLINLDKEIPVRN